MRTAFSSFALALSLVAFLACGGDDDVPPGTDGGGRDGYVPPGTDGGPMPGVDGGPGGCVPTYEICGDRIDQNCDGMEQPCGDNDSDRFNACRPGEDPIGGACDCDDSRADTWPGADELCDGVDNDCNGRVDEASACCAGCAGIDPTRADICTEAGACECSTEPGEGPCPEGQTCCAGGCTDILTDFGNCGFCGRACNDQTDRCTVGDCRCGDGPACDLITMCVSGSCGG